MDFRQVVIENEMEQKQQQKQKCRRNIFDAKYGRSHVFHCRCDTIPKNQTQNVFSSSRRKHEFRAIKHIQRIECQVLQQLNRC